MRSNALETRKELETDIIVHIESERDQASPTYIKVLLNRRYRRSVLV